MGSGLNWNQIKNKTCYIPKVSKLSEEKKTSMLTGLKELSLACKFYRPEHNAEEVGGRATLWNWILKILKCKNEIFQRIELKE